MDVNQATALLGGLSPAQFMRRHWHKRPLLVRQAVPGARPPLARSQLFALAARDDVESRLVVCRGAQWQVRHGPLSRRSLPPVEQPAWTLLVQGLDLHVEAAHELLERFRFVPDARLDDLMVSWASDGGGVGPHLDAYDVFLLQVHGQRRWRVGRARDTRWVPGAPLKLLANFVPESDWLLDPGDMLYLPPGWGHDGTAVGECMTCSVGFRAPSVNELAAELLQRLADLDDSGDADRRYRDPGQPATAAPGSIPVDLADFARRSIEHALRRPQAIERALGEVLTEPKPRVWFQAGDPGASAGSRGVRLDRRTRMMYDRRHLFVNGESYRVGGSDARMLRRLADERALSATECQRLGADARAALDGWREAGWLHAGELEQP